MMDADEAERGGERVAAEELEECVWKLKREGGVRADWIGQMDEGAEAQLVNAVGGKTPRG